MVVLCGSWMRGVGQLRRASEAQGSMRARTRPPPRAGARGVGSITRLARSAGPGDGPMDPSPYMIYIYKL
jgi:hypothetical protein